MWAGVVVLVVTRGVGAEPVGLAGPRLSVSEKVDASEAGEDTPATLTCHAQAHPSPHYRCVLQV